MNKISAKEIFSIENDSQFDQVALEIFHYQASGCRVYKEFIQSLGTRVGSIKKVAQIPFLPVEFFKSHTIVSGDEEAEIIFRSSATTGEESKHFINDISLYEHSFREGFRRFYGDIRDYAFLALLPSYLEREGSSLIYMADVLIRESGNPKSGYFLHNHDELNQLLQELQTSKTRVILLGVTYALLDFVEKYTINYPGLIVMETGGMKGKRREMIREELHHILCRGFGIASIHSEYGMTELLSQAYSKGNGLFSCPPWMKVLIRETNDPLKLLETNQTGGINVIDLANLNSCSFIATQDVGRLYPGGCFEVLGRFDNSDIRGCNLMIQ